MTTEIESRLLADARQYYEEACTLLHMYGEVSDVKKLILADFFLREITRLDSTWMDLNREAAVVAVALWTIIGTARNAAEMRTMSIDELTAVLRACEDDIRNARESIFSETA